MTDNALPGGIVLGSCSASPLIVMFFREPITRAIQKRADKMETGKAMFVVQGFFEMFETLLSYFSNTISFIRIGAFAVSHAAIMEVVLQLAGAESGHPNWIGVIFGNLFVCGFEGLIVGSRYSVWNITKCSAASTKAADMRLNLIQNRIIKNRANKKSGGSYHDFSNKIIFIIALIVSIIVPFGYYLLGEKSKKRYKRAIGTNAFFFFGAFAIAGIMLLPAPDVQAAEAVSADSGFATGLGYLAAALVTGLSLHPAAASPWQARASAALGAIQRRFQRTR